MSLLNELNRRNVLRAGAAYIVSAWLLIQVAETIFPLFGFGDGPARLVVIVLAIGFVPVLIFSWAFEWTPQGFKREGEIDPEQSRSPQSGKKLDRIIMLVLALGLGYFAFDKFVLAPQRDVAITESATKAGAEQAREEARLGMFNDKSIAVLPFTNRSKLEEDEYFTDGMHDELLTRLSRAASLRVISRTSVMRYRDTLMSIPEIARELSVATILEGGVQRSGGQVRINVQLIDANTDEHLWAEIYDRELSAENLFAIQSEISTAIADSLEATLSPEEQTRIYALPTTDLDAYNHFLRGRQLMTLRNTDDLEQAFEEFSRATEIDPEFALAWVGVADVAELLINSGAMDWDKDSEVRIQAAEKAIALDDQLGEAYTALASIYKDQGEDDKAEAAFLKAIELSPNYAQAFQRYALSLERREDREKRLQLLYKAAQLDPLSLIVQHNIASTLSNMRRGDEARKVIHRTLEREPDFAFGYSFLAELDANEGLLASAIQLYRKALKLDPENGQLLRQTATALIALGEFEAVAAIREDMARLLGPDNTQVVLLDYDLFNANSDWQAGIDRMNNLPRTAPSWASTPWRTTFLYLWALEFDHAYESLLTWYPSVLDPEAWERGLGGVGEINCNYAGMLIEGGEEDLGRQLLQVIIDKIEAVPEVERKETFYGMSAAHCYIIADDQDQAMDWIESDDPQEMLQIWYYWSQWPWWKLLEDNPRYIKLVNTIEVKLAEQRALFREMDEVGNEFPN